VHVLHPAEAPLERGRKDDDGHLRPPLAQLGGDVGAEAPDAEVVIEHGDIDAVQQLLRLLDRIGGLGDVAVLAKDGRAQEKVLRVIVEQQHANRLFLRALLGGTGGSDFLNV
jgi:hypothetical protein